jgi:hypothetical protein
MMGHYFERPHLIAAYKEEKFIGIFVTYPEETLTLEELDKYMGEATCFVAEEIPLEISDDVTPENYMYVLEEMIENFSESRLSELFGSELLFIPKTLH